MERLNVDTHGRTFQPWADGHQCNFTWIDVARRNAVLAKRAYEKRRGFLLTGGSVGRKGFGRVRTKQRSGFA